MYSYGFRRDDRCSEIVTQWPNGTALPRAPGRVTLLLFVHPHCACAHATLTELERLLAIHQLRHPNRMPSICVVATIPPLADETWKESRIVRRSLALRGARLFLDHAGVEAFRFGAQTSGTVMLFDPDERRVFAGGITISRGHEGPSLGGTTLARLIAGERGDAVVDQSTIPVFGCRLVSSPVGESASEMAPRETGAGKTASEGTVPRTACTQFFRGPQVLSPGWSLPSDDRGN